MVMPVVVLRLSLVMLLFTQELPKCNLIQISGQILLLFLTLKVPFTQLLKLNLLLLLQTEINVVLVTSALTEETQLPLKLSANRPKLINISHLKPLPKTQELEIFK
jgi:hypothetical protein